MKIGIITKILGMNILSRKIIGRKRIRISRIGSKTRDEDRNKNKNAYENSHVEQKDNRR